MQSSILLGLDARIRVWTFGSEPGTFDPYKMQKFTSHTHAAALDLHEA